MKGIDIEGELHWSSKDRWIVLLGGIGVLAVGSLAIWWFNSQIPLRFLQFLWFIPNSIMGLLGLSCIIVATIPRKTLWLMEMVSAFFGD